MRNVLSGRLQLGVALFLLVCVCVLRAADVPDSIMLNIKQRRTVDFGEDVKSASSDSTAVTLEGIGEKRLVVVGRETGVSTVNYALRSGRSGKISVTVGNVDKTLTAIQEYLNRQLEDVIGVNVSVNNALQVIEVDGRVKLVKDRDKLNSVMSRMQSKWKDKIINNVTVSIDTAIIESGLQKVLQSSHIDDASVSADSGLSRLVITGKAYTDDARILAKNAAVSYSKKLRLGDVEIVNNIKVTDALFEVEFQYFQFSDQLKKDIGSDLFNNIGLSAQGSGSYSDGERPQYAAVVNVDIGKIFNMLAEDGYVAVSKKQTISTRNGKEGESRFGGDFILRPEATVGGGNATVEHIPFGFLIKATPTFSNAEEVNLDVEVEVSSISEVTKEKDVSKKSSSTRQTIVMPLNNSAVLAVSSSSSVGQGRGGTPILRRIPILNLVFGKKAKSVEKSYSGFLVMPRVVGSKRVAAASISERTDDIIRKIEDKLKKNKGAAL